jgi:hypothetical protein
MSGAQKKLNMSAVDVDGGGNEPVPPLPSQYCTDMSMWVCRREAKHRSRVSAKLWMYADYKIWDILEIAGHMRKKWPGGCFAV